MLSVALGLGVPGQFASSGASGIVGCMLGHLLLHTQGCKLITTTTCIAQLSVCRALAWGWE